MLRFSAYVIISYESSIYSLNYLIVAVSDYIDKFLYDFKPSVIPATIISSSLSLKLIFSSVSYIDWEALNKELAKLTISTIYLIIYYNN